MKTVVVVALTQTPGSIVAASVARARTEQRRQRGVPCGLLDQIGSTSSTYWRGR